MGLSSLVSSLFFPSGRLSPEKRAHSPLHETIEEMAVPSLPSPYFSLVLVLGSRRAAFPLLPPSPKPMMVNERKWTVPGAMVLWSLPRTPISRKWKKFFFPATESWEGQKNTRPTELSRREKVGFLRALFSPVGTHSSLFIFSYIKYS